MAEAIEINFPTESDKNPKIDSEIKNQILGFDVKESMKKDEESCPEEYTIDNYYKEDELGRSVLEMKYLAPGVKNPWELWKRQAKALASVEKTPELQDKWEAAFFDALKKLVDLERDWIKKGEGKSLYIRPFVIANQYAIQASPSSNYKFMIICAPATLYYTKKLKVLIADKYSRAASGGVGYAKAAGNYAGQFFPTNLAKEQGCDQIIWTDSNEHKYRGSWYNECFFRINNSLVTAPITDTILDGVTRKSIIQIANDMGINVEIKKISTNELIDSALKGNLKEIFGAGTAAVVSEIKGFQYKDQYYELSHIDNSYSKILKDELVGIQTNSRPDTHNWRFKI